MMVDGGFLPRAAVMADIIILSDFYLKVQQTWLATHPSC